MEVKRNKNKELPINGFGDKEEPIKVKGFGIRKWPIKGFGDREEDDADLRKLCGVDTYRGAG